MNYKRIDAGMLLLVLVFPVTGCRTTPPVSVGEIEAVYQAQLTIDPEDRIWSRAPVYPVPLLLQDMVEPRLLEPSTHEVRAQAVHDGSSIALRLEWKDASRDDRPGPGLFADACAIQFPALREGDLPAPQMGEEDRVVEITYWSAFWQAAVDGRADEIQALYPGASVDHYPFEAPSLEPGSTQQLEMADLYSPARSLENLMAGPRSRPVEDLLAEGPGTLAPTGEMTSDGRGLYTGAGWSVILLRPLPGDLPRGARLQVAFAVWDGSQKEVGARKMRSGWIPLLIQEEK